MLQLLLHHVCNMSDTSAFSPRHVPEAPDTSQFVLCVLFQVIVILMLSRDVKPSRRNYVDTSR